jgi:hypothetical protein
MAAYGRTPNIRFEKKAMQRLYVNPSAVRPGQIQVYTLVNRDGMALGYLVMKRLRRPTAPSKPEVPLQKLQLLNLKSR